MEYQLYPQGDNGVMIELEADISDIARQKVFMVTSYLQHHSFAWMIEYIPAFTTVTIFYDPAHVNNLSLGKIRPYDFVCRQINIALQGLKMENPVSPRTVEIPVCYGGEYGPDLGYVAEYNGLSNEEVIHLHTGGSYCVFMIGFAPGFPYMGGMNEAIAAPRRTSPRLAIPAGTVGIAGKQTGVYPIETPGGWQLIGRTPLKLFRPDKERPSLLQAGDSIRFFEISEQEYLRWKEPIE
ncbi:5-oxoprolinase subunit PxpB [Bacillaceae bacterium Marseille-Q3522]|nr:5-oxoprolinase subunit PxpB [Bacillaceae bacterium Marseille-Q3522]